MANIDIDIQNISDKNKSSDGEIVLITGENGEQCYALRYPDGSIKLIDHSKNDSTYD